MRALELIGFDGPRSLRLAERPVPRPSAGEVLVRFRAAALNHLDVFVTRGLPKRPLPAVLGSDGTGVVEAVGEGVTELRVGADALLYPVLSCGACEECRRGREVHCERFAILGEHVDGTFQDALAVPARNVFPRPPHLSWEEAAAIPLSWLTAWRLLFTRGGLSAGDTVGVVGAGGGVATAALLLGKCRGLRVVATSRDAAKRDRALALGADAVFPSEAFAKGVREVTGGAGARAVIDTVGPATIEESFRALAREGAVLTVGSTSGPKVELLLPRLFFKHHSLITSTMGNRSEFVAMLAELNAKQLHPPVDRVFPLAEGAQAFAHLEDGAQFGKVVLRH